MFISTILLSLGEIWTINEQDMDSLIIGWFLVLHSLHADWFKLLLMAVGVWNAINWVPFVDAIVTRSELICILILASRKLDKVSEACRNTEMLWKDSLSSK